jgi:CheY-like chemotaxis protein
MITGWHAKRKDIFDGLNSDARLAYFEMSMQAVRPKSLPTRQMSLLASTPAGRGDSSIYGRAFCSLQQVSGSQTLKLRYSPVSPRQASLEVPIEILESNQATIDLVFSDVPMPGEMDGFGLATWVRTNRPGLPIILASADGKKSEAAKVLCENEPFFAKPYDVQLVVARIRSLIDASNKKGNAN